MKKGIILAILSSMVLISCGAKKDDLALKNNEKLKNIISEELGEFKINIYFDGTNNESKPEIGEQTVFLNGQEIVGQYLMQNLIQGPDIKGRLKPVLPKDTKLISFSIKDDIAIINLSKEAIIKMSAAKEQACLESILTTLTQLSAIKKVNILVENQMIESLGGNFNISKPFGKEDLNGLKN